MVEAWVVGLVGGYLIGSVPMGLWIGRWCRGVDLRAGGSGKIGATNVYRSLGLRWSLLVFLLDTAKGVVAVAIVRFAFDSPTADVLAGLAALIGHVYPLFAGFRGGRAAATGLGTVLILTPSAGGIAICVWLGVLAGGRIMSLAVLLALTVSSVTQGLLVAYGGEPDAYYGFVVASWVIIIIAHRDNIRRLASGSEHALRLPSARHASVLDPGGGS